MVGARLRLRSERGRIDGAGGNDPTHDTRGPQQPGQGAGVDSGNRHDSVIHEILPQRLVGAPIAGDGRLLADDEPSHLGPARLDVFRGDAVVANLRTGHRDNLPGIGRVGQDLLIPRHVCVEHHLAVRLPGRPGRGPAEPRAVLQHKYRVHRLGTRSSDAATRTWSDGGTSTVVTQA